MKKSEEVCSLNSTVEKKKNEISSLSNKCSDLQRNLDVTTLKLNILVDENNQLQESLKENEKILNVKNSELKNNKLVIDGYVLTISSLKKDLARSQEKNTIVEESLSSETGKCVELIKKLRGIH